MQYFAIFMLFAWVPITVGFFAMMPSRRAAATSLIAAWLALPATAIPISGLPDYSKMTATSIGIVFGTILFELPRLINLRPRWFDIPIVVLCCTHFPASISNGDGAYDGVAQSLTYIFRWGLPYLVGRLYFGDLESLRALGIGVIVGGVAYILPCFWEMRMSPHIASSIYGMSSGMLEVRLGGYRPRVFLQNGLELGMWMSAASLAAYCFWRSGSLKAIAGEPACRLILPSLLGTTILCKSSGALTLLALGIATIWASVRFKTKVFVVCIILLAPTYYTLRISGIWSGEGLLDLLYAWFDPERAWSLDFRFRNENLLIEHTLERPLLGWAAWGKNLLIDPAKLRAAGVLNKAIPDGLWIIMFSSVGVIGLASWTLAVLLPPIIFLRSFSTDEWLDPLVAPAAFFAVVLCLYVIDCLANGMVNLIYVVAMGGLSSASLSRDRYRILCVGKAGPPGSTAEMLPNDPVALPVASRGESLAGRYTSLGRALATRGRYREARSAWFQALDTWDRLTSTHPEDHRYLSSWCDCCNDLACFLIDQPEPGPGDLDQAVGLALRATEASPHRHEYWNTLGAACYRAGDVRAAVDALHRSLALQRNAGSAFDYFYLSMACSRLSQSDIAQSWYDQGLAWLEAHAPDHAPLHQLGVEAKAELERSEDSGPSLHGDAHVRNRTN